MTFYHDLNVARKKSKTLDFYHFVNDLPETFKCDEKNFIFLHFIIPLREVFFLMEINPMKNKESFLLSSV